jgi:hypothetical protein
MRPNGPVMVALSLKLASREHTPELRLATLCIPGVALATSVTPQRSHPLAPTARSTANAHPLTLELIRPLACLSGILRPAQFT